MKIDEQNHTSPISEVFAGCYRAQPLVEHSPEFRSWVEDIRAISKDKQDLLAEITRAFQDNEGLKNRKAKEPAFRIYEARIRVLTDIAEECGATPYEIKVAHFEALSELFRQEVFETMRDDGLHGFSFQNLIDFMQKYNLEWTE